MFGGERKSRVRDLVTVKSKNCIHHISREMRSREREREREKRKEGNKI
jgi:hypothetical protein